MESLSRAATRTLRIDYSLYNHLPTGAGKFEKGSVAWVSAIDPAAGKEGFTVVKEPCVEENEVRGLCRGIGMVWVCV